MKKKKTYRIISTVSLIVMLAALLSLGVTWFLFQRSSLEYQELARTARAEAEAADPQETAEDTEPVRTDLEEPAEPQEEQEAVEIPVDFAYLTGLNPDIMGWIMVAGTDIDYPILYDEENTQFYLNHNYTGAFTPSGSICILADNARDMRDFNTVVYGHNMINGKMFAQLHRFEKQSFFDENRTVLVYLPDRVLVYEIFAAYRTDDLHQIKNFDYDTAEGRQAYLDRVYSHEKHAIFDPSLTVTPEDRILTLSTCVGNSAYRYLVQAVLTSELPGKPAAAGEN